MGRKPIDETGKRYGNLVVLHQTTQEEHPHPTGIGYHVLWTCLCDCGKISYVQGNDLRNGHITSCGHNNLINLTGKTFNRLTVIKKVDYKEHKYDTNQGAVWECKCSCGNITYVRGTDLHSGRIKSCGCLRDEVARKNLACKKPSLGEQKIINILTKENIKFEREKSFLDDKRISNYRFDFFLPEKNICIEFQGKQHMEYTKFFYKSRADFLKAQERDRRKISYCLAHNISLYCIPFWEIDQISSFKDITSEKFFVKSKFHNDEVWREHQKNIKQKT